MSVLRFHRHRWLSALLAAFLGALLSTSADEPAPLLLDDLVVVAAGRELPAMDVPQSVALVSRGESRFAAAGTMVDLLIGLPGVMVQRTAPGQASPYLRGFTGYRTLLLVDGIRVNNSVFRSGPNQYWATVDPWALERIELGRGPAAVLYGTDAVGGVVNLVTLDPALGNGILGSSEWRLSSAEESVAGRIEGSTGFGEQAGLRLGVTSREWGDLHGGREVGVQPGTGYREWGADAKYRRTDAAGGVLTVAAQTFRQAGVPRTHSTRDGLRWEGTVPGSDLRRDLDQDRSLAYVQYDGGAGQSPLDAFKLSLSWQQQGESEDRIRGDGRRQDQGFTVDTLGLLLSGFKEHDSGTWDMGLDFYRDWVSSYRFDHPSDGGTPARRIQGPVGDDAVYDLAGAYLRWQYSRPDQWDLIASGRLAYARAEVGSYQDPLSGEVASLERDWNSAVGSLQGIFHLNTNVRVYASLAQSYRAPNLSDLTRFDAARSNEIETPSPAIDPEAYRTAELGIKSAHERFLLEAAYFYTEIQSQIIRTPTGRIIDGRGEVTKQNAGSGFVHGVELSGSYMPNAQWEFYANFSWLEGRIDNYLEDTPDVPPVREPISRMMPPQAVAGVVYRMKDRPVAIQAQAHLVGPQDLLSSRDAGDGQRIPPGGTPGYELFDLRLTWRPSGNLQLTAAIDNLTDADYRVHGSGSNGPGRNFIASARLRF